MTTCVTFRTRPSSTLNSFLYDQNCLRWLGSSLMNSGPLQMNGRSTLSTGSFLVSSLRCRSFSLLNRTNETLTSRGISSAEGVVEALTDCLAKSSLYQACMLCRSHTFVGGATCAGDVQELQTSSSYMISRGR